MPLLRRSTLVVVCFVSLALLPMAAQTASVIHADRHDVSQPLRTMVLAPLHVKGDVVPGEHSDFEEFSKPIKGPTFADTALQTSVSSPVGTIAGLNFAGLGEGDYGYAVSYPVPDSNGAVGASQYVQSVASSFAVFDKGTGKLLLGPSSTNSLFSNFGGSCETTQAGDTVVQYDKIANRWVIGAMAQRLPSGEGFSYACIAVSTSSDATGSYNRYALNLQQIDYLKIGVWPDGYYLGLNNPQNTNATACAMDRSAMLNGGAANTVCFTKNGFNTLLPSDLDGSTLPPAGSPNYFVGGINSGKNVLNLFKFHADFNNTANSTLTGPIAINVTPYTPSCLGMGPGYYRACVPQKGSSAKLETLSDRLMYRNAYRNFSGHESMVVNHTVDVAGASGHSTGVRWYELRSAGDGNFTVHQQGTYAPDSNSRWMGSIAMDKAGNIALGYAISSSSMHPSMAYTGRNSTDPLGALAGEKIVFSGTGNSSSNTLWGDYTNMTLDPVDDCTLWYTSEYYKAGQSNWSTRISSFKFAACK